MNDIAHAITLLEASPVFLEHLIGGYSAEQLRTRRIPGRWSAHEHACHVCVGEKFAFHKRIALFLTEPSPVIQPLSGDDFAPDFYISMDIGQSLDEFHRLRNLSLQYIRDFPEDLWDSRAQHPEYFLYTPRIMVRHLLMHDHWHFYRIEELLLTREGFLV